MNADAQDEECITDLLPGSPSTLSLRKNDRAIDAVNEFISNPRIQRVFINSSNQALRNLFTNYIRRNSKFNVDTFNALAIRNIRDCFRRSVHIKTRNTKDVLEGELVEKTIVRDDPGDVKEIRISISSSNTSKTVTLSKYLLPLIERINVGDVIYVEPGIGIVQRLGRSESRFDEHDLEGDKYIQLSKGSVETTRDVETNMTVYDFDYSFNRYSSDISMFTRDHVNQILSEYVAMEAVHFLDSCICIEDCHLLAESALGDLYGEMDSFPFVRVVMSGNGGQARNKTYDGFLVVNLNDEDDIDILANASEKLENDAFMNAVRNSLTGNNLEAVRTVLAISKNADEFTEMMSPQSR